MTELVRELFGNRKLIFELAKADFRKRFCGLLLRHYLDVCPTDCDRTHLLHVFSARL